MSLGVTASEALKSAGASDSVTPMPFWYLGGWYEAVIRWVSISGVQRAIATTVDGTGAVFCLVRTCRTCDVRIAMTRIVWRCPWCRREQRFTAQLARRLYRRAQRLRTVCMSCTQSFRPLRGSACYCSQACRQRAYRQRIKATGKTVEVQQPALEAPAAAV